MHGALRIFSTKSFEANNLLSFIDNYAQDSVHLLITDGIISDFRHLFSHEVRMRIIVQRILTSYQLQRILMDSDERPHYIALSSGVLNTWDGMIIAGIYDIIRIKSYYRGCTIYLNIIGDPGKLSRYMGSRKIGIGVY